MAPVKTRREVTWLGSAATARLGCAGNACAGRLGKSAEARLGALALGYAAGESQGRHDMVRRDAGDVGTRVSDTGGVVAHGRQGTAWSLHAGHGARDGVGSRTERQAGTSEAGHAW